MADEDCRFLYFKPGGKWKDDGAGRFPRPPSPGVYYEVNHDAIFEENGCMPGLVEGYRAYDLTIVVVPYDSCEVETAFPRMIKGKIE